MVLIDISPDKPRNTSLTSNVTRNNAIEGIPVTFTCSADSAPSPLYQLRFKGVSLGHFSDGVFTIQKVRASDQGIYDCVPRNILGIGQRATLNLIVLGKYSERKFIFICNQLVSVVILIVH